MKETSLINIAILCNPLAAAGRSVELAERIALLLDQKAISYSSFVHKWPDNFESFTDVWIVGGDGTLNYFINHYPANRLPLVVFKGGTGNDTHWLLYGEITPEQQAEKVLGCTPRPVDAGLCNDRFFINGVGIGFEGAVAKSLTGKKKRPGKTSFLLTILQKIFTYRSQEYTLEAGELSINSKWSAGR
jgi:diacylglycerol kinase (ATP)